MHSDDDGNAVFTMDQPRTAFGSLGIDAVTDVGAGLDRKVAALLRVIGVDPGARVRLRAARRRSAGTLRAHRIRRA